MPAVVKVLVVGGGVGGLTAAVAMRQRGIAVDLIEINRDHSVYGVGIIQPNNTLRALEKIGLAQACVDRGGAFPGWRIFDADGNALFDAAGSSNAIAKYPPNNGITRPILQKLLLDKAQASGVTIRLGLSIDKLGQDEAGATAELSDGSSATYDLIVAADGIYSKMRSLLFPVSPAPHFCGQGVWRYNLPRPGTMAWGEVHNAHRVKVGLVPMSPELMYMFVVTDRVEVARDDPQLAEMMRAHLAGFTGPIAALAEQIVDPAGVVYRSMETVLLEPVWHQGRIVIIGDAAHATTPHLAQGAAMAIEDAVLLAEMLDGPGELDSILTAFTARRLPRAKLVIDNSLQIARWEMDEWEGVATADANPGMLLGQATQALMEAY